LIVGCGVCDFLALRIVLLADRGRVEGLRGGGTEWREEYAKLKEVPDFPKVILGEVMRILSKINTIKRG
jgi:hypothetical protein